MIKDSGERTAYDTGAVRDLKEGKGRFDLMPLDTIWDVFNLPFFDIIDRFKRTGDVRTLYRALDLLVEGFYKGNLQDMLLDLAKHFEEGAQKYGERNWEKGIPIHSYMDSAMRHYVKAWAKWDDEPHIRACIWNLLCAIWTMKHHPEMDDFTEGENAAD